MMLNCSKINSSIQRIILDGTKTPHRTSYPVIYKENDRYYLAVFVFFFTADDIRTGQVDRPTMWAIADIETGEIIERQYTKEKEFSNASYDIKYDIRSDNEYDIRSNDKYDISEEYYEKAFSILDSVREKIITEGVFDKTEYAKYMDMILVNIPEEYKRFYVDLSTDYKKRTTALVIIDVQKGFLSEETKHIPEKIKELLSENQFDFIFATRFKNHEKSSFVKYLDWYEFLDENDWKLDEYIKSVSDAIFDKYCYSCFTDEFKEYIISNNIDKLYFVGIDTDCCVLESVTDCFELGIDYSVIADCCASSGGVESHKAGIRVMERLIGEKYIENK